MRLVLPIAALAAALLFSSCSDDPVGPGTHTPVDANYQASMDFFTSGIQSLWGRSGDVYASGLAIMHNDGESWEPLVLPALDSGYLHTWGTSNGDIYAMGNYYIQRYDGAEWHRLPTPASTRSVWGADNGEIFVVGYDRLYHYDGVDWAVDSLETTYPWGDPWNDVTGGDADDVYITGSGGWLGHYDGNSWTSTRPDSNRDFYNGWKAPDGQLFLVSYDSLFTYDGTNLTSVDVGPYRVDNVSGRSSTEVYCAARSSGNPYESVLQYDGNHWTPIVDFDHYVSLVWGDQANGRLFAVSEGVVWQIEGTTTQQSLGLDRFENGFNDVWGDEDGIYAIGSKAYRYVDETWVDLKKQELTTQEAYAIWGRSGHELYAVGSSMILQYDGETWTWVSGGASSSLIDVRGNDHEVFAVGYGGVILRNDGHSWKPMESGTSYDLISVYAWEDGAFAGGDGGALLRYDGHEWHPVDSPVSWRILEIFGFGPDRVFAVGSNGTEICRFDGKTWTPIFIGFVGSANVSLWGTSERNLFIGQGNGNVLHFDGNAWSSLPRVTSAAFTGIWGDANGQLFAAGDVGLVRYHR